MVADPLFGLTDSMPIPDKHEVSMIMIIKSGDDDI